MTGVIVAEEPGTGRRFWAGPPAAPGGLAVVANRTLLARAVDTLRRAGADSIVVVADRDAEPALRSALGGDALGLRWIGVLGPPDIADAVLRADTECGGDRFLVHTTNGLWLDGSLDRLAVLAAAHDALVVVAPSAHRRASCAGAELQVGGLHSVNRRVVDALRGMPAGSADDRLFAAIDATVDTGGLVHALMTDAWWFHTTAADDQLAINRAALDTLEPGAPEVLPSVRIEGRVEIHPAARVEASIIRGPVVIGADARVVDAYVGPYTAIGEAVTIENAEIENSIVHTGARVEHVGVRLEASVLGQGAAVGRSLDLPRAARLVVGEDACVTFA